MPLRTPTLALVLAGVCCAPASAAETAAPAFHFSGFGTLGWAHQDTDEADYVRPGQPRFSRFGLDSNLGLQATATFGPTFSGTVQVLARREYTDHFRANVEWAFVKARINDTLSVRLGRVALPAYVVSDSRNVGYANIAIRPPVEVYGQVPLNSLNGVDLIASLPMGDATWTAQAGYGKLKNRYDTATIEGKDTLALALALEQGPFTVRVGHVRTDLTISGSSDLDDVLGALRMTGFDDLAARLAPAGKRARFTGIGMTMDWRNVLLQSEFTRRTTDSYVSDNTGRYLMAGYRMGRFVPYAAYGKLSTDSPRSDGTVTMAGPLVPLAMGVNYLLRGDAQSTRTVGLRWNALPYASVKVQADFVRPAAGTDGYLVRVQPAYRGQTVRVWSAAVDVVF